MITIALGGDKQALPINQNTSQVVLAWMAEVDRRGDERRELSGADKDPGLAAGFVSLTIVVVVWGRSSTTASTPHQKKARLAPASDAPITAPAITSLG